MINLNKTSIKSPATVFLFTFLLLFGMIVFPCNAWTEYYTNTQSAGTSQVQLDFAAAAWKNASITKIEMSDIYTYGYSGNRYSGSYSGIIHSDNFVTHIGNYSATWSNLGAGWSNMDMTITIDDCAYNDDGFGMSRFYFEGLEPYIKNTGSDPWVYDKDNGTPNVIPWAGIGAAFVSTSAPVHKYSKSFKGTSVFYSGSAVTIPVAEFACDNVYSNPDATITCTDLSSNSPTGWEFGVWDHEDNSTFAYYTTGSPPWEFELSDLADYDVGLTVSNSAGSDTEIKEEYLHIQLFTNWTPTPTPTVTAPTWVPIETINMTYMNESFFYNSTFGSMFQPWITFWDYLGGFFTDILTTVQEILNWPFNQINEQMEGITGIADDTLMSLSAYTVVPLLILGKYINVIPWQIQSLITILLVVEVMFIIIGMRR